MREAGYIGRFAPSPTGGLHFGSLVAAVGSYLDARAAGGRWLVRMEDLDPAREVPGSAGEILRTLERFRLSWDGPVLFQSSRFEAYRELLDRLRREGLVYPCSCSRRDVPGVYPGTCRAGAPGRRESYAWRLRVPESPVCFLDRVQGPQLQQLDSEVGDFVLMRADGLFAYQLAVVADDASQGVTDVVRGADLLDSTARQIWLQRCLGYSQPRYLHLPVATNESGQKLSKQTRAPELRPGEELADLCQALRFLGQPEPRGGALDEILVSAATHWSVPSIPLLARHGR